MKYIAFSFDDARSDTYEVAMPIMKKYGLTGTVNVISSFVLNPDNYHFKSSPKGMTAEQVLKWQKWGGEIASHGSTHKNSTNEITKSIKELNRIGVDTRDIGFASPESWLTESNIDSTGIDNLLDNGTVSYLRSGIQVRRKGLIYTALSIIERYSHSKSLYRKLNKCNIIQGKHRIYSSAAVKAYTSLAQIQSMINIVGSDEALILMFHSILPKSDRSYGKDHYYWDVERFDKLCGWLRKQRDISVLTTRALIKQMER